MKLFTQYPIAHHLRLRSKHMSSHPAAFPNCWMYIIATNFFYVEVQLNKHVNTNLSLKVIFL